MRPLLNPANQLQHAHSVDDLRAMAKRRLPRGVFDFFEGGAEDEVTLRENRLAFERIRLKPRVLVDVQAPDLSTTLLGARSALPLVIAPTGAIGAGWPQADIAIARTAAKFGVPYTLSTTATSTIEAVADQAGGRLWFQLYVLRDPAFTESLIARAATAGYEALVVTLDLATGGKRERDLHNRFTIPLRPGLRTAWDFATHPHWLWQMLRYGAPQFENLRGFGGSEEAGLSIAAKVGNSLDASFDHQALLRLRARWPGKLIVKGLVHQDDAKQLACMGVDALWVSNHGGRQLDGAIATADALPDVVHAAAGMPVLIDSGVRRGVDVVKAVALGAQAVAVGRATLYGAMAAGEAGSDRALAILADEIRRAMQLCGTPRILDIGPHLLAQSR